jgi:hypothetical protein
MGRIVATGTRDDLVADGAGLEDAFFVAVSRRGV